MTAELPTLPEGWRWMSLSSFAGKPQYGWTTKARTDGPVRLLRTTDITSGAIDWTRVPACEVVPPNVSKYELHEGDVVVSRAGSVGFSYLVDGSCPPRTVFASYLMRVRPDFAVMEPRLLHHYMRSPRYWAEVHDAAVGVGMPNVNGSKLGAFRIPVPPRSVQRELTALLDDAFDRGLSAGTHLASALRAIDQFRQAVLAAACSGRLTADWRNVTAFESVEKMITRVRLEQSSTGRRASDDVIPGRYIMSVGRPDRPAPEGWEWTPLLRIARLESGHTPSRKHPEYWEGDIPWIGIQDARAHHGGRIIDTRQHVNDLGLQNSAARLLPANTVCLSRTASVGYVVLMGRPMATSQDFVNWICSEALVPEFLVYAIMAEGEGIRRFGRGTTHTTIYFPEVKALHICLPPAQEQAEIVRRISQLLAIGEGLRQRIELANQRIDQTSQAILAQAFRGELSGLVVS